MCNSMDVDQVRFFARYSGNGMGERIPPEERRKRPVAKEVPGTSDHRCEKPAKAHGLRAFQSGQTWVREAGFGLALQFDVLTRTIYQALS